MLPAWSTSWRRRSSDGGVGDVPIRLNMTGCPNGCARPYNAEIGIVGRGKKSYDVYVGGSAYGDRLGERIRTDVPLDQLAATLAPVFARYAESAGAGRDGGDAGTFGDWAHEVGAATIETWLPEPVVRRRRGGEGLVIALVGAGPGDPELLTVRAARLLAEADVVVHDALVGDGVLALARPDAELIDVGKRPGRGGAPGADHTLLVELAASDRRGRAAEGRRPVRLRARRRGGHGAQRRRCGVRGGARHHVGRGRARRGRRPGDDAGVSAAFTVVTGHRRHGAAEGTPTATSTGARWPESAARSSC